MVLLAKLYWLVAYSLRSILKKHDFLLVGYERSSEIIFNLQQKLFTPLRTMCLLIVISYAVFLLGSISSFGIFNICFKTLLFIFSFSLMIAMSIDGIFIFAVCLFEIGMQLLGYKAPKRLQKISFDAFCDALEAIFTKESQYCPKRLSTENSSVSEKNFSLKEEANRILSRINSVMSTIVITIRQLPFILFVIACLFSTAMATETTPLNNTGWFYNQLNDTEKTIYNGFASNREALFDGEEVTIPFAYSDMNTADYVDIYMVTIQTAQRAYLADFPAEKIWMDNCKLFLSYKNGFFQMIVRPKDEFDMRKATETFEQAADEFISTLSGTDLEKLQAIHNWLVCNVQYDLNATYKGNAYGAIVEGRSVCSGFAYSFKYLADKVGLNVVYVQGYYYYPKTNTYGYHAWNMVEVDGEWLLVDVTLDRSIGNFSLFSWQNLGYYYPDSLFTYPS